MVYNENYVFEPEKLSILQEGTDIAIIEIGLIVHKAQELAKILSEQGISCTVANMHTIKPIDTD